MKDKGIVTSGQIFILLFVSRITITVFCSPAISGVNTLWDFMLPVIISMFLSLILLIPVLSLYKKNRLMSVSEYSNRFFGKGGNIITIFYSLYFFINALYSLNSYYLFLRYIAPQNIQIWMIICTLIIACIYASFKGIEAITRLSGIIFIAIFVLIIIITYFLLPTLTNDNYISIQYTKFDSIFNTIAFIMSRMNGVAVFAMLYPITKGNIIRHSVIWIISVFLFFVTTVLLITGSLGEYLNNQPFPIYQSINGSGPLQRLNPIFLAVITAGVFCDISMLMYVISQCIKNVSNENIGRRFTVISGISITIICLIISQNNYLMGILFNNIIGFILTLTFSALIPIIILAVDKIKNNKIRTNRRFLKISLLAITILLFSSIFSGCNTTQLNQRLIVQGIGIDKFNDEYKLTAIVLDTDSEENENEIKLTYSEGISVPEAISLLETRSGKDILFSQCLFIIMNENAVKDCNNTIEYFVNNNDILKNTNLIVCKESSEDIITTAISDFKYKSSDINALSDSNVSKQNVVQCSLLDYISFRNNQYNGIMMPYISINRKLSALQNYGSVIINNNFEIAYLSEDETDGVLIINQKVNNYIETIAFQNNQDIIYQIKNIISSITPQIVNNNMKITINLNITLSEKYDNNHKSLIYNDLYKKIQLGIQKTLKENSCDIFSLNKSIKLQYPNYYKNFFYNWDIVLKKSEIEININI